MASLNGGDDDVIGRSPSMVWRIAADRVLVRRVGDRSERPTSELLGLAALIWVVLDAPTRRGAVHAELGDDAPVSTDDVALALERMVEAGVLTVSPA